MSGTANEVYNPIPSRNGDHSSGAFATACLWLGQMPAALSGKEAIGDKGPDTIHDSRASDDQLLVAAQSGDQHAFGELCCRHSPVVQKRIFSIVKNREDAEDALQDTLLSAYRHLGTFRHTCKFSSWLTSIGINAALGILRKRKIRREGQTEFLNEESGTWEAAEFVDHSFDPEKLYSRHEIVLVVRREVEKLKPTLRSVMKQYYEAECSLEESAKVLDISATAAKSRLMRGRKSLRWYLKRHGVTDSRVLSCFDVSERKRAR